jgi:4-hydroxybenzoate polyprenyltransferase
LRRVWSTIRFHEVLPLQASPLIGGVLASSTFGPEDLVRATILLAGSCCLVAHVFLFNDWAGIEGDLRSPSRADRTFVALGVDRRSVGRVALALLAAALALCSFLGVVPLFSALGVAGASALYSAPATHLKGLPVLGTALHFAGALLHFLLGYSSFSVVDPVGVATSCFFGLVFAAGHLMHEVRDYEGDLVNNIQTNAVAFGKRSGFIAGLALFCSAYALLAALAWTGALPRIMLIALLAIPLHLVASITALRDGMTVSGLQQLQTRYHIIAAALGALLVASAAFSWMTR